MSRALTRRVASDWLTTMSPLSDRNKRRVLAYVKAMSSPDEEGPFGHVSKDFRLTSSSIGSPMDVEHAKQWRRSVLRAFPDLEIRVAGALMVAEKDTVALRLRWRGTHRGEFRGIHPTGRKVDVCLFAFFRVRNGLIDRETHMTDTLALLEQIRGDPVGSRSDCFSPNAMAPDAPFPAAAH